MNADRIDRIIDDAMGKIADIMVADLAHGANDWAYVRVWPDGSVTSGREASQCLPESEYFHRQPHPLTVWAVSGNRTPVSPDDGVFMRTDDANGSYLGLPGDDEYYDTCDLDDDDTARLTSAGWRRFDLDRTPEGLVDALDLDREREEVADSIVAWAEGNLAD